MRIAYVAHVNDGSQSGVVHKVSAQVGRWRAQGHAVRVFVVTRDRVAPWQSRLGDAVVGHYGGPLSRMRAMARLASDVRRFSPAIVYLRWDLFYPPMLWFPRRAALAIEVNTDDLREYALGSRIRSAYNARTRSVILRRARALVFVTEELGNHPSFRRYPGTHRVISNGIDLNAYPMLPSPEGENPRLAFVGSAGQSWQGVDKLVTLAAMRPEWRFDVIGAHSEDRVSLPNITWHGPLERAGVIGVLAQADVGVGTLALHRKSMTEACPLKVREYLAVGLPVIYANVDRDADRLGTLALRIANSESNVVDDLARIDAFVLSSRGVRVPRSSLSHIDVAYKEQQRLALFDEIAGD